MGGNDFAETDAYATAALELALGRGGDQAVVKEGNNVSYFGGKLQTVEKSNKGKSRVIAHALNRVIENASKVIVIEILTWTALGRRLESTVSAK